MKEGPPSIRIESRWLAGVTVMAVVVIVATLPGRISLYPAWASYALGVAMIVPMGICAAHWWMTASREPPRIGSAPASQV